MRDEPHPLPEVTRERCTVEWPIRCGPPSRGWGCTLLSPASQVGIYELSMLSTEGGSVRSVSPDLSDAASGPSASAIGSNDELEALGSTFVVSCASARALAVLEQQWSRLRARTKALPTGIAIDLRSVPTDLQGRVLLSQLTIRAIEAAAGTRLMLHAAGVSDSHGRVLALVGPSGMGKTTASVYLSRRGFGYVTDETVSIGVLGDVLQFPRPLSLRQRDGEVQRSPDQLGLGVPPADLRIGRIVLLDRDASHTGAPALAAVPLVDALLELIPHASALAMLPDPLQFMSRIIDRCGGVLRLTYAELGQPVLSMLSSCWLKRWTFTPPGGSRHHTRSGARAGQVPPRCARWPAGLSRQNPGRDRVAG